MVKPGRPRSFNEDEVLTAAMMVFWERGYVRTSMQDLRRAVGVLPGSLYAAFGDKHALFTRALERYADEQRAVRQLLERDQPLASNLRDLLSSVLQAAEDFPGRGCMLGNTATEMHADDETLRIVTTALRDLEDTVAQALRAAQAAGTVRDDIDSGSYARLVVALMQGLHVLARAHGEPQRLSDVIDVALLPISPTQP